MQAPILQATGNLSLQFSLTHVHRLPSQWRPSKSRLLCQHFVKSSKLCSWSLNSSTPAAVSSCGRDQRLFRSCHDRKAPPPLRTRVGGVALEENVLEESQQGTNSSGLNDDFSAVLEILKVDDKFRFHKVPKLKALKLKLDPPLVLRILKHKEVKPSNAWKFFVWAKKQMGFKHSTETYNVIIVTLLEIRKFTSVYYLLDDMYKDGVSLTPETCVKMAKTFGSAGMVERAIRSLNHMTRLGSPATTRHLNSLVMQLLKSQHHYKAYIAYREMAKTGCEPDGLTFKLLLRELASVEKVDLACRVFDDMRTRGCEPDAETASIAVSILSQTGRIDDAIVVFEKVKQKQIKLNAKVYSHLLNGLGETSNVEKALEILEEMHSLGYIPEKASIAILVDFLVDSGREDDAQKCRSLIEESGD